MSRRPKCSAKTKAEKRCSRLAVEGTDRCAQHTERELASVTAIAEAVKAKHPGGRPPVLTPSRKTEVVRLLNTTGLPLRTVAAAVNVTATTLHNELKRGKDLKEAYETALMQDKTPRELTAREQELLEFFDQCESAQVKRDIAAAATIAKLMMQAKSEAVQARLAIWHLERRYEEYAPLQRSVVDATMSGEPEPMRIIIGLDPDVLTREE
jgi:predicted DNA-binding protein YlxM (UPF0122 family)